MEYMGEVVTAAEFRKRSKVYQQEGIEHHYFMSVGHNKVIDATRKGCIARFVNHSCGPNCILQKWMVGGAIRMGIFAQKPIKSGEEVTFDYKFERLAGTDPQTCFCGSPECKGIIGVSKERSAATAADGAMLDDEDGDGLNDTTIADIDEEIEDDTMTRHQRDDIRRRHAAMDYDDEDYSGNASSGDDDDGERDEDDAGSDDEHANIIARMKYNRIRRRNKKGLISPEQVLKFVQIMHQSAGETRIIEILIGKLMDTNNRRLLKSLIGLQGAAILRSWLQDYQENEIMLIKLLECIAHLPISTRNTVEDNKLEEVVKPLCSYRDEMVANRAADLIEKWSTLRHAFKIPKKIRKEHTVTSPADTGEGTSTPVASASNRQSPAPNTNNASSLTVAIPGSHDYSSVTNGNANGYTRVHSTSPGPYSGWGDNRSYQHRHSSFGRSRTNQYSGNTNGWGGSNRKRSFDNFRSQSPVNQHQPHAVGTRGNEGVPPPLPHTTHGSPRSPSGHRGNRRGRGGFGNGHYFKRSRYPSSYHSSRSRSPTDRSYPRNSRYKFDYPPNVAGGGNATGRRGSGTYPSRSAMAPGWHTANTADGQVYYYHEKTKETRWDAPLLNSNDGNGDLGMANSNLALAESAASSRIPSSSSTTDIANRRNQNQGSLNDGYPIAAAMASTTLDEKSSAAATKPNLQRSEMASIGGSKILGIAQQQLVTPETDGGDAVHHHQHPAGSSKPSTVASLATDGADTGVGSLSGNNNSSKSAKLEKKATSEVAAFVVRAMSKFKDQLGHEEFKREAKKITKILMEKERKSSSFDPARLCELGQHKKTKIKQFVADYVSKLLGASQRKTA